MFLTGEQEGNYVDSHGQSGVARSFVRKTRV